ncbi:PDR/VanB family oxidoreductase [Streptomyces chartreusis]|uniref:PDR/VanB family oxidoreductase n=1 Tax=Streptomyces chartreusis TaxID=1969 RepID=UPI00363F3D03
MTASAGSSVTLELDLRVVHRELVTDDVVVLELAPGDTASLVGWDAGAHLDIAVPGVGPRQYSLCGPPGAATYTIAVKREPAGRGGSAYLHDEVRAGGVLRATGLRNHFGLEEAERYVFVAGGIGVTPILAMVREAERTGRPWELHYLGRRRGQMPFLSWIEDLAGDRVRVYESDIDGIPDAAAIVAGASSPAAGTLVYCCGPEALMSAVEEAGRLHGLQVRSERFAPADEAHHDGDTGFELVLARSERTLWVPADRSALAVMADAGVNVLSSCGEGTCGTCEVAIIEGVADHRDSILEDDEREANEYMYPCVSRSRGPRIVIEA